MAKIISNGQELVLPSGGVADVSVDPTLTKSDDGTIGVTTPVKAILTREAFEALPETERNTGMYVVYDEEDESSTPSTPGGSSSSEEVYSSEETRIGTWFGKPLYRKVFTGTIPTNLTVNTITKFAVGTVANKDTLVSVQGMVPTTTTDNQYTIPIYINGLWICVMIWANMLHLCVYPPSEDTISKLSGQQFHLIAEYTKITDTATN